MVPATSEEYHTLLIPFRPVNISSEHGKRGIKRPTIVERISLVAFVFPGYTDRGDYCNAGMMLVQVRGLRRLLT